jgi:sortase A
MTEWFGAGRGRLVLLVFGVVAVVAIGAVAVVVGTGMLSVVDAEPAKRAIQPVGAEKATPKPIAEEVAKTADDSEPKEKADQIERAVKEPEPKKEKAESKSPSASASASASNSPAAVPSDTYMTLTVPAMGISDIPVVEGTTEASLSQGAGHYTGSGYPWVAGSNTYIAGHRLGYPGTPSDHVFWNLPNLTMGDKIYLTDSNGHTYTYAVSDILEVPLDDLSVTGPTGTDTVSLQTCIEDYGDYWTPGPDWNVRYIVRGTLI